VPWKAADIPDQSGRVAVVTGANGGLGLETTRELARHGAHVVMAARNPQKTEAAVADIRGTVAGASLEVVPLDLGSLASVKAAAEQIRGGHPRIDLLINNAGVMGIPEQKTADGFEMQLGVDHLGHWALTALLLGAVVSSPGARVVTVTSSAHHMGRAVDVSNPHLQGKYRPWSAYGQAKLANFHFGLGLQREFERAGLRTASLIAHPGLSNTDLQTVSVQETGGGKSQRFFEILAQRTGMSPATGALSQLRAAVDPRAKGGEFYGPLFVSNGPPVRKPVLRWWDMQSGIRKLWDVSARETGIALDVAAVAAG
jgi:NAD(P)-dependent dehydrogenase (short-subunit alcohol dehydrogenase family)